MLKTLLLVALVIAQIHNYTNKKSFHPSIGTKALTSAVPPKLTINRPLILYTMIYIHLITGWIPVSAYFTLNFILLNISLNFTKFRASLTSPFRITFITAFSPPADLFIQVIILTTLDHRFIILNNILAFTVVSVNYNSIPFSSGIFVFIYTYIYWGLRLCDVLVTTSDMILYPIGNVRIRLQVKKLLLFTCSFMVEDFKGGSIN
jgi:hypothetical protein